MYKKTGQGVPYKLFEMKGLGHVMESIIQKGIAKKVTIPFGHLPDDITLCLTGVYCVEDCMKNGSMIELSYIRTYLKTGDGLNMSGDPGYEAWVKQNEADILKVHGLSYDGSASIEESTNTIDETVINFMKQYRSYKRSSTVSSAILDYTKIININNRMLELFTSEPQKYSKDIETSKTEILLAEKALGFLKIQNPGLSVSGVLDKISE